MRNNDYFENYNQMSDSQKRDHCQYIIDDCNFWLQQTSNPQKIRFRKRWIEEAEKELEILNKDKVKQQNEDYPF